MNSQWEPRNKEIIDKYLNKISICVIAKEYNISRQRVYQIIVSNKKHRDKLCIGKDTVNENLSKIKEMRNNGIAWNSIVDKLGISNPLVIWKYLNKKEFTKYGCKENEKRCPYCKKVKLRSEFSRDKRKNQESGYCKECVAKVHRERKYWRTNEN